MNPNELPVIVLIASVPRIDVLVKGALTSIAKQHKQPVRVVIVSDKHTISSCEQQKLTSCLPDISLTVLKNSHQQGAAGSWNTGLEYIRTYFTNCFVAILDDDDTWDNTHLSDCYRFAQNGAQVVLAGINVVDAGKVVISNIPDGLTPDDFLIGNPGWQGSNTFVHIKLLDQAGNFSGGMISCNDRDLAIRILDLKPQIAYTGNATVNWHINHRADALSARRSQQKLIGVSQFFSKYQHRMTAEQKDLFFTRIHRLFHWTRTEIEDVVRSTSFEKQYSLS